MRSFSVLLLFCWVLLAGGLVWAAPRLVVDQVEYNFGSVPQGEKVQHSFTFSNAGDAPLIVQKVRSSCGCTAALVTSRNLGPGESGELKTSFDSARFRGEVSKTVYLYTNDPLAPVMQLVIKGQVRELFALTPRQVQFGRVAPGQTVEASVTLTNNTGEDLVFDPVQTTTPELRADLDEQMSAGESQDIRIFLKPKPGQTRFSGYVMLKAVGDKPYDLRLPVYATVEE